MMENEVDIPIEMFYFGFARVINNILFIPQNYIGLRYASKILATQKSKF